eukprot:gene6584-biopygen13453
MYTTRSFGLDDMNQRKGPEGDQRYYVRVFFAGGYPAAAIWVRFFKFYRAVRVRFFKFYRAVRVRDASAAVAPCGFSPFIVAAGGGADGGDAAAIAAAAVIGGGGGERVRAAARSRRRGRLRVAAATQLRPHALQQLPEVVHAAAGALAPESRRLLLLTATVSDKGHRLPEVVGRVREHDVLWRRVEQLLFARLVL